MKKGVKKMTVNYYVGWTGMPWKTELMPEATAPSNYKDPAKIAVAVEEKRAKQQETAGSVPIYGRIESVSVLNDAGAVLFEHTLDAPVEGSGHDDTSSGLAFVDFLLDTFTFPTEDSDYELSDGRGNGPARLIGFEVKTALKMAAMELFNQKPGSTRARNLPTRMWYRRTFCVDPFEMLRAGVPDLTLGSAMSFLDGTVSSSDVSCRTSALVARELATRTGIADYSELMAEKIAAVSP
jgi:hypothetical protein